VTQYRGRGRPRKTDEPRLKKKKTGQLGARHPNNKKALESHYKKLPEIAKTSGPKAWAATREKGRKNREKREAQTVEQAVEEYEREQDNLARRELAQRELCRKHLLAYVLRFNPGYLAGWVHKDICARLERFMADVEAGKSPRLMLQMPPRHGKSTLAEFPAFVLGHHPDWEIMSCSYAETLALDFSRAVRERLRDKENRVLFPESAIDRENQNAKGWKTTKRGGLQPAGVEGPLTGKGAHVLIIDDPVKNATEAESETTRESVFRWYETTAYTRLAPGGGVLVIQTRWHMDDLSGRLEYRMREGTGDTWEIVRYPAEAEDDEQFRNKGEPLHPERYSAAQLAMIKRAVGPRTWQALYQQNPAPDEGAMFQSSMMQYYQKEQLPEQLTFVTCWDLAIGQKEANDKTVGLTWGKDITGDYWFVDCRHGHWDAYEIVAEVCDQFEKWKSFFTGIEKDKIAQAVGPYLDTEIENRELYSLHVEELPPAREGNKQHRARSLQGLMRRGRVWLPHPDEAPWVSELVSELLQFPYGRRDDHVDAAAWLALQAADTPAPGFTYSRIPRRESWRDRLRYYTDRARPKTMMSS
jgi:predicted phage terminase large subunit-like protein